MKKVLSLTAILLATVVPSLAARTQAQDSHAPSTSDKVNNVAPRSGTGGDEASKKAEAKREPKKTAESKKKSETKKTEKKSEAKKTEPSSSTASAAPINAPDVNAATSDAPAKTPAASVPVAAAKTAATSDPPKATPIAPSTSPAMTNIYRVGIGDVLDIRLLNTSASSESTLFTVLAGGLLEYPLAGEPVAVAGLTTEEINAQLTPKIKLYDDPRLTVSVREYASHRVIVTGLVSDPGTKVLRREAVPLYVVLAEAQPRAEAARATIMRQGDKSITVDLTNQTATSELVVSGDVIRLSAAPPAQPQFFYLGGQVYAPGQKAFHEGLTLMQAVLAGGGPTRFAGDEVKVMRQGQDGRLVTTRYNLKKIEAGKIPDPLLQAGDRIEVSRGGW
ncbi:MAG TPA: polysaccharide biosynthesis/export family protein [Pyrinomonadaceae bacterium]|jgi:protein involved in polysaccharide export with SLBB domain